MKVGITVNECFSKYSVPELLPESQQLLEIVEPDAFFEACAKELGI